MSDNENKTPEVMDAKAKYEQLRKEKALKRLKKPKKNPEKILT